MRVMKRRVGSNKDAWKMRTSKFSCIVIIHCYILRYYVTLKRHRSLTFNFFPRSTRARNYLHVTCTVYTKQKRFLPTLWENTSEE